MNRKKTNKVLLAVLIPAAFFMMTSFSGGMGRHSSHNYSYPEGWNLAELNLADGVYQGESTGFRESLIVEVTVEQGEVINVAVTDHNEVGPQFYARPIRLVPREIVEEQNTSVDSVTGATATSVAIMSAVEDALKSAIAE